MSSYVYIYVCVYFFIDDFFSYPFIFLYNIILVWQFLIFLYKYIRFYIIINNLFLIWC